TWVSFTVSPDSIVGVVLGGPAEAGGAPVTPVTPDRRAPYERCCHRVNNRGQETDPRVKPIAAKGANRSTPAGSEVNPGRRRGSGSSPRPGSGGPSRAPTPRRPATGCRRGRRGAVRRRGSGRGWPGTGSGPRRGPRRRG